MHGIKVVLIGGSIAGCAIAILLRRLGCHVVILERSSGKIAQGSGITLPELVVKQCKEQDLFDDSIPCLALNRRIFMRKEQGHEHTPFWQQPIHALALNWSDVYTNLRQRIEPDSYHANTEVTRMEKVNDRYSIQTTQGKLYEADLVIAADGVDSMVRTLLFPHTSPQYAGYVAWRGVIENFTCLESLFEKQVPYSVYPHGHVLLYRVPARGYLLTGNTLINWVMYEEVGEMDLSRLLIDHQGKPHTRSLPAGTLSPQHMSHLFELSAKKLPAAIVPLILRTPEPFLQAIFDFKLSPYADDSLIFAGDAAATLRPHTASGVGKALTDALGLAQIMANNPSQGMREQVAMWKQKQQEFLIEEVQKAKLMGAALVSNTPDWGSMNQKLMDKWWSTVMQGTHWYVTSTR